MVLRTQPGTPPESGTDLQQSGDDDDEPRYGVVEVEDSGLGSYGTGGIPQSRAGVQAG